MATINEEDLKRIRRIIEQGWDAHTTAPDCRGEYNEKPKSYGQCYPTAMVIHKIFGWDIMCKRSQKESHYWNRLPNGNEVDFTSDQHGGDGLHPTKTGNLCKSICGKPISEISKSKKSQKLLKMSKKNLKKMIDNKYKNNNPRDSTERWVLLLKRVRKPLRKLKKELR